MKENRVVLFGELLLRLAPEGERFITPAHKINLYPGGSEANVAVSLAQWDIPVSYVSRVPDNTISREVLSLLNSRGVDTAHSLFGGDRLGLYFLLSANGLTKGEVVYDRKYSAFSELRPGEVPWEKLFEGKSWFHWSALTPALNTNLCQVLLEGLKVARERGMRISVDLNYRNRLWNYGKAPEDVMPELVRYCDIIMGNIWAANKMLSIPVNEGLTRATPKARYFQEASASAEALFQAFPACKHLAYTFRFMDSPTHNLLYGTYHTREEHYISSEHETSELVDRIGSGDAFMAGFIRGLIQNLPGQEIIELATSAGFNKLFVPGDFGNGQI